MARNLNLTIDQATTFNTTLPAVKNSSGSIVNLTGYSVAASMKISYLTTNSTEFVATISNPTGGVITLALTAQQTTLLNPGRYVFDVIITDPSSNVTRAFEGLVDVRPGVTSLTPVIRHTPNSRQTFIDYCKRKLGYPVLEINLDQDQMEDLVDFALQAFREYHYDGSMRTYLKHILTAEDVENEWIPCSDLILSVVRALHYQESSINLFDLRYQLRLQDFYNFTNVSMVHYEITQEKLALLDWMLNPDQQIRFTRHTNRIYINLDWKKQVLVGDYIIFEVFAATDEKTYPNVWDDKWLKLYGTALFKQQWGANMKKFYGTQLIGGTQMNGQQMFDEATKEIERLDAQLHDQYSQPIRMFLG